jgi:acyl-CoA synthetase (NDP forming)
MSYDTVALSFACDQNTQASEMTCTVSMAGGNADTDTPQTAVLKGNQISFNTATIVQGASLLSQATPATAAAAGVSATSTAALAQHTGSAASVGVQVSALFAVAGAVVMSIL